MTEITGLLLAAGYGTRLRPWTNSWPKCLMPIQGKALLEYWLDSLQGLASFTEIYVNTHYLAEKVNSFLDRASFQNTVKRLHEKKLLGTAGTIKKNHEFLRNKRVLLAHADNLCICDFRDFIDFHFNRRPPDTVMTMMTFQTSHPQNCGIVDCRQDGVVQQFYEKSSEAHGNTANAAVYLLEPEIIDWIHSKQGVSDFSTEVIPKFLNRIATWNNHDILLDIGSQEALSAAQNLIGDPWPIIADDWQKAFETLPIYGEVKWHGHRKQPQP